MCVYFVGKMAERGRIRTSDTAFTPYDNFLRVAALSHSATSPKINSTAPRPFRALNRSRRSRHFRLPTFLVEPRPEVYGRIDEPFGQDFFNIPVSLDLHCHPAFQS